MVIRRLFDRRNRYSASDSDEKLTLLQQLDGMKIKAASELKLLHAALCFIRAFPDSRRHYRLANAELTGMEHRVDELPVAEQSRLSDTGIVGTPVHYGFSYEVAVWLQRRAPGAVSIDWDDDHDPAGLDEILTQLLMPAEDEFFNGGHISGKEWIELVSANSEGTDFDWLLAQLRNEKFASFWTELYNAAELWLKWDLRGAQLSKSLNRLPTKDVCSRQHGLRKPGGSVKKEIAQPLEFVSRLTPRAGSRMIDLAIASLAVRHRETYHFNHANPREVYLADVGEGVSIAIFGLLKRYRYPLECTMGYLIISNGTPVGYGGASILFRQVNTGINIFDEYRGSEAAYLWVQVMRAFHQIAGCTRYIVNAFQFGADNDEALKSGAFWFYYRLGYRPVSTEIRSLARRELAKLRRDKRHPSDVRTLRRLASCDMHLTLTGSRQRDLFEERWIETSSMLATRVLGAAGGRTRKVSATRVAARLARDIGIRSFDRWSPSEQDAFTRIAPFAASIGPGNWPAAAKRSMRELLRAKGGGCEAEYARLLGQHELFLSALRKACRHAEIA